MTADTCTEVYYPAWGRGMSPVRCTRTAKATVIYRSASRRVCGTHRNRYNRLGEPWQIAEDQEASA